MDAVIGGARVRARRRHSRKMMSDPSARKELVMRIVSTLGEAKQPQAVHDVAHAVGAALEDCQSVLAELTGLGIARAAASGGYTLA
jgi:hypothetical protein